MNINCMGCETRKFAVDLETLSEVGAITLVCDMCGDKTVVRYERGGIEIARQKDANHDKHQIKRAP